MDVTVTVAAAGTPEARPPPGAPHTQGPPHPGPRAPGAGHCATRPTFCHKERGGRGPRALPMSVPGSWTQHRPATRSWGSTWGEGRGVRAGGRRRPAARGPPPPGRTRPRFVYKTDARLGASGQSYKNRGCSERTRSGRASPRVMGGPGPGSVGSNSGPDPESWGHESAPRGPRSGVRAAPLPRGDPPGAPALPRGPGPARVCVGGPLREQGGPPRPASQGSSGEAGPRTPAPSGGRWRRTWGPKGRRRRWVKGDQLPRAGRPGPGRWPRG